LNELQLNAFDNGDFWNYGFANQIMEVSGIFFLTLMLCQWGMLETKLWHMKNSAKKKKTSGPMISVKNK